MHIPFTKAHGAGNDFLLTWIEDAPARDFPEVARAICDRHTGVGADGWMLVDASAQSIRLFNADGSEPEISGNGTRCAAALLYNSGKASGDAVHIRTGAGVKELRLMEWSGAQYTFEMNMGVPLDKGVHAVAGMEATILDVGNPQAAIICAAFPENWRELGARIERDALFPNRTNVSFVRVVDEHTVDVVFWERGCGETMSSGTGSTGAAAAAILRGLAKSPVRVVTPAGDLLFRWTESAWLTGPAEIVATGEFLLPDLLRKMEVLHTPRVQGETRDIAARSALEMQIAIQPPKGIGNGRFELLWL